MTVEYDATFEREVLAGLAHDPTYRKRAKRILANYMFQDETYAWVWTSVVPRLGPKDTITEGVLKACARRDFPNDEKKREAAFRHALKAVRFEAESPVASLAELENFAMHRRLESVMSEAVKLLQKGQVEEARQALAKVSRAGKSLEYDFTDWWESWEERQAARAHERDNPDEYIRAPFPPSETITKWLDGGSGPGELGIILATTGMGKSALAASCVYGLALHGLNVLAITTEMHHRYYSTRLDARWTGKPYREIKLAEWTEDELAQVEAKRHRLDERLRGKIRIASTSVRKCTTEVIEQIRDDMIDDGIIPDVFIFDSADHMKPSERTQTRRDKETASYWDAKSFAEEWEIPVITTAHASKEVVGKIANAENAGESYDKARIADWMISANSPKRKAWKDTHLLLKMIKTRNGPSGLEVMVRKDMSRILFTEVDPDELDADEEEDDESEDEDE